jgi:diguanylate cyclase (GGDEF)-like protein
MDHVWRVLAAELRDIDLIVDSGPREFLVLLPETGEEGALMAGERLRAAVSRMRLVQRPDLVLSLSVGLASLPENGGTVEDLLHLADQGIYAAESRGGNRVCAAAPGEVFRWGTPAEAPAADQAARV